MYYPPFGALANIIVRSTKKKKRCRAARRSAGC